jgi:hypothetical protein
VVVQGLDRLEVVDLGPVAGTSELVSLAVNNRNDDDTGAQALYARLFEPIDLHKVDTVIIAPDGVLQLVPFHHLRLPDGRFWTEQVELRVVQSGRDLLRRAPDRLASGLLALGGIDFDAEPIQVADRQPADGPGGATPVLSESQADTLRSRTEQVFHAGFGARPRSRDEVAQITHL